MMVRARRRRMAAVVTVCGALLALAACSTRQGSGAKVFDGQIAELMPLHDGDTFLYLASGGPRGERLELARVAAMPQAGDLMVTVTSGEVVVSGLHLRQSADALSVVGEADVAGNVGVLYASPLPLLTRPLTAGERRAKSPLDVFRPSDGFRLDKGEVEMIVSSARDPSTSEIVIRTRRRLILTERQIVIEERRWLRPGVGEVRSEAGINGVITERRELVCAKVGGKQVGTCREQ
jgi:hypothetical protein